MGRRVGVGCAMAVLAIDQCTKTFVLNSPSLATGIEVVSILNLVLVRNQGVSFGMFGGLEWWALVLLALSISAALTVWLWRAQSRFVSLAIGLVIGGALGNVLDRVRFRAVTDFLDFHLGHYHWPAFNFADVAIVCGISLLLADGMRRKEGQ